MSPLIDFRRMYSASMLENCTKPCSMNRRIWPTHFASAALQAFSDEATGWVRRVHCPLEDLQESNIEKVDLVLGFDVFEQLEDVRTALQAIWTLLNPGGRAVQRIDYSAHGVWRTAEHPLQFLTVPKWLWEAMGSNRDDENRIGHYQVLAMAREIGFETTVLHESRYDDAVVNGILPQLRRRWPERGREDFCVKNALVCFKKE
ncbi:MAG: methyltransferase domain-containing protein [Deltaproteobacteria bacterium]|nr:methyltransferase domain-containing protein [Deltaproteobacteria bacterium]